MDNLKGKDLKFSLSQLDDNAKIYIMNEKGKYKEIINTHIIDEKRMIIIVKR